MGGFDGNRASADGCMLLIVGEADSRFDGVVLGWALGNTEGRVDGLGLGAVVGRQLGDEDGDSVSDADGVVEGD